MINKERLVNTFIELVKIDSPSKQEQNLSIYLHKKLKDLGLDVYIDNSGAEFGVDGGNIIARLKGQKQGKIPLCFCAHMDTVISNQAVNVVIEDDLIRTDRKSILGADDKAGIAILLETLTIIKEQKLVHGDIDFVFTICEELGLLGSKHIDFKQLKAEYGYVLDSGEDVGTIIIQAPCQEDFKVEFLGREAHSGVNPEAGINAIQMSADFLSWFPYGKIDDKTTANIGVIRGGKAVNIVPEKVQLLGEIRSTDNQKVEKWIKEIKEKVNEVAIKHRGNCRFQSEKMYSAFMLKADDMVVKIATKALEAIGITASLKSRGGGSDANNFNEKGIPTVNLAIGLTKGHTNDEEITVENLVKSVQFVLSIIREVTHDSYQVGRS